MSKLPLSVGQEGLWFIHRLAPLSAAYNVALAVRIGTTVDESRLAGAVAAVEARHDMLRSTFLEVDGRPWRTVHPAGRDGSPALEVHDLVAGCDDEHMRSLAHQRSMAPFPLAEGGRLVRVVLLRRAPDDAVLMVAAHHIISDAFSMFLVLRDLLDAYQALGADRSSPALPPLPHSFDDYVTMERELLDSPRRERLAGYWREACSGSEAARLVPDRSAPGLPGGSNGAACELRTPPDCPARLRAAAAAAKATPFVYLLATFQAVLHRMTGQADFLVGVPVAARTVPRLREVVGYQVNTLPIRARFEATTTFTDVLASAKRQMSLGIANLAYPSPLMVDSRGQAGAAQPPPLFRIAFTMLSAEHLGRSLPIVSNGATEATATEYAGLRLSYFDIPQQEGQLDVSVEMRYSGPSLSGVFRYRTDLFERATIEGMVDRYLRFTDVALADPGTRVSDVSLVDQAELDRLLAFGTG